MSSLSHPLRLTHSHPLTHTHSPSHPLTHSLTVVGVYQELERAFDDQKSSTTENDSIEVLLSRAGFVMHHIYSDRVSNVRVCVCVCERERESEWVSLCTCVCEIGFCVSMCACMCVCVCQGKRE